MSTQEKKAERADIDVPPKPEEFGLDPQDFQDIQEKTLEKKENQGKKIYCKKTTVVVRKNDMGTHCERIVFHNV